MYIEIWLSAGVIPSAEPVWEELDGVGQVAWQYRAYSRVNK